MNITEPNEQWIDDIRKYCRKLNIETKDLHSVLSDPKVLLTIRGKTSDSSFSRPENRILPNNENTNE